MWPSPAGREASSGGRAPPYVRHRPERTLLYQLVEEYYPAFKAHLAAQGTDLPGYVQQEFEDYLKCGRLEHGFLRVRCDSCHAEHLVAFSCKKRGFCPSCGARRMAESAALLVDEVFPEQPVRQWVLSVPYPLRFLFASRPEVMGRVLGIVYRCIATHLIQKAGFSRKAAQAGDDFRPRREAAISKRRVAAEGHSKTKTRLERLRQDIAVLDVSEELLTEAEAIDELRERLGGYRKAARDRPGLIARRATLVEQARQRFAEIRPDLSLDDMEQVRPLLARRRRCTELGGRKEALESAVDKVHQRHDEAKRKLALKHDELTSLPPSVSYEAQPAGDLGKAPVGDVERQRPVPVEDAVP